MGILFYRRNYNGSKNGKWGWYKDGDKKKNYKYVGEIKNWKPNGQGTRTYVDKYLGGKYSGGWKDGEFHGQGTETSILGFKYEGGYKDGKKHGQGTYTFPNRTKGIGYFRGNKPWNVTKYDKERNILGKYVNGKWIKN